MRSIQLSYGRVILQVTARKGLGGERGIRTLDGLLTHTPLAGVRLRPLGHLSAATCQLSLTWPWMLATRREGIQRARVDRPEIGAGGLAKGGKNTGGGPRRKGLRESAERAAGRSPSGTTS